MTKPAAIPLREVRRQLRIVAIVGAAESGGLAPLPSLQLHAVAFFADALAPVWGLRILDAQLLKRREGPTSPTLQHDIDRLVGTGVVRASSIRHVEDADGNWRLDAEYSLNQKLAEPVLGVARSFEHFAVQLQYVREVVLAMSALGAMGIEKASASDASYGDALVDFGGMVDIEGERYRSNQTARVAMRFGELMQPNIRLTDAEKVHLYVRELYNRLDRAA